MNIYIVRHGETEHNVNGVVQGQINSPLTDNGIRQARERSDSFQDKNFDIAYSSDLGRAYDTANIILRDRGIEVLTDARLRERAFGEYEGRPKEEWVRVMRKYLDYVKTKTAEETWGLSFAEGVESDEQITNRFMEFLEELSSSNEAENVLVVTHGAMMRSLLIWIKWNDGVVPPGSISNLAYFQLKKDENDWKVLEHDGIILKK